MGLMGESARLLNTRQSHGQRGSTGDSPVPAGTSGTTVNTPADEVAKAKATVAALLPAPRTEENGIAVAGTAGAAAGAAGGRSPWRRC